VGGGLSSGAWLGPSFRYHRQTGLTEGTLQAYDVLLLDTGAALHIDRGNDGGGQRKPKAPYRRSACSSSTAWQDRTRSTQPGLQRRLESHRVWVIDQGPTAMKRAARLSVRQVTASRFLFVGHGEKFVGLGAVQPERIASRILEGRRLVAGEQGPGAR